MFKYVFSISILIFLTQPVYADTDRDYIADLISTQGTVETLPADSRDWIPAMDFQKLYPKDTVRTGELSRAAILFVDHTQIKLNEKTILEIKDIELGNLTEVSWGRTARSLFNLVTGEIWIRSGGEVIDLEIDTPVGSATVRGTEFVVRADKKKTTVTVIDGSVNLANEYGEVLIKSGEQGVAEEDKPPYKTVIINPEDAVQWALYYPGNISSQDYRGVTQDERIIIEKFFDLYRQRKLAEAISLVSDAKSPSLLTLLGFGELMAGDVDSAKAHITKALAINPDFSLAHSILSNIYLVQNNKEKASEEAELAVVTNPDSPSAYVSLSWVRQSWFDIPGAVELCRKAVSLDPENIQALVTLCRLLFGSDKIKEAEDIIDRAIQIAPEEGTVNASKGFLLLAKGKTNESIEYFNKSIRQDTTQGLGHLGLGLAYIRVKNIPEGLREMLIATLLEPKVSLYQSYMGKAYFQVAKEYARWGIRQGEALNYEKYINLAQKTLSYASYLDPRDPTPYLYSGILYTDLNRPVEAIETLNKSIELNDNRAVYRSRFLLDKDRAVENISLAQAYEMLGLSVWGSFLAMRSLQADFSTSGAHRFLGHTYLKLRARTKAAGSELLQSRITMPVNENSFNTYNNYTSLFETPEYNSSIIAKAGDDEVREYTGTLYGGSGRYAFAHATSYYNDSGYLPENNDYESWWSTTYLKYSLGMRAHIFASFTSLLEDYGDFPNTWNPFQNDVDFRTSGDIYEFAGGYYYEVDSDTHILIYTKRKEDEFKRRDNKDKDRHITKSWDNQIEIIRRFGDHQVVAGIDYYDGRISYSSQTKIPPLEIHFPDTVVPQRFTAFLIRDYWRTNEYLEFDLGMRYDILQNGNPFAGDTINTRELNPQAGLLFKPFNNTTIRTAAIRSTQTFFEANLFPTNTSGFIIDHNEEPSSQNMEYAAAWDQLLGDKTFLTVSGSYRDRETPTVTDVTIEDKFVSSGIVLNRIINKYTAFAGEYSFLRSDDSIGRRNDHHLKVHLGFVHHSGWFAELTEGYIYQENEELAVAEPFNASFWTTDAVLGYEFPKKRGKLTLSVENLFDNDFRVVTDPLALDNRLPVRRAILKAEIYF